MSGGRGRFVSFRLALFGWEVWEFLGFHWIVIFCFAAFCSCMWFCVCFGKKVLTSVDVGCIAETLSLLGLKMCDSECEYLSALFRVFGMLQMSQLLFVILEWKSCNLPFRSKGSHLPAHLHRGTHAKPAGSRVRNTVQVSHQNSSKIKALLRCIPFPHSESLV